MTVEQVDNYARSAAARLPRIVVEGCDNPVFAVEDGRGELVYALRVAHPEFRGPVFAPGLYRGTVSDGSGDERRRKVLDLQAGGDPDEVVRVTLPR